MGTDDSHCVELSPSTINMDAVDYIRTDVNEQAETCDVLRDTSSHSYDGEDDSKADEVDVAIFAPNSNATVVVEGTDDDTSLTGLVVPDEQSDGSITHHVQVGDVLRPQTNTAKRYNVRVKDGIPNDLAPELFRLGLEHANQ
jgi:hypothetical protein